MIAINVINGGKMNQFLHINFFLNGIAIIMKLNKYLIGVVMHQMVTRGYNVLDMSLFDLSIADKNGHIIEHIDSECYCIPYCGLPCCPYCIASGCGCIEHSPLCFFDDICRHCGNGCYE